MIDINKLSSRFATRRLEEVDVNSVVVLMEKNTLFYKYTDARPTKEDVLGDMKATPPGIGIDDKYYFGFYDGDMLVAIMDLIDGFPSPEIAYIGFFMMNAEYQGRGVGKSIIDEVLAYLETTGKTKVQLAIDKGNPQSTHFWTKKNGFEIIREADNDGWIKLVAERKLG